MDEVFFRAGQLALYLLWALFTGAVICFLLGIWTSRNDTKKKPEEAKRLFGWWG